ncbi:MAG: tRNA (adenosine(37)-N6)-threonylcarbamoyltransferase complex transferase subunit TsaD, partial [Nanoarchaeota archaeon]|nr:tRNA (adenosine(37)-N6)-threonylcarbamoyltransferase complex transferase subunit TsaD [Nanoarchaeota archaeon]
TEKGGMIPNKVADHHIEVCDSVLKTALDKANIKETDIDLISFSQGPGIGHCLRIGAFFSRCLSLKLKKPLIGVNHCIAHLSIGSMITEIKDPVLLYVSGANTQVIAYEGNKYRIFGETLDNGLGNFLDSIARFLELGFPGGPKIEQLAKKSKNFIELPYNVKGMDVSFGGLLTNIKQKYQKGIPKEDLCFSLQETVFAMMIETAERALAHCDKKELILGGGVACNKRLQEMAKKMCADRNALCYILPNQFNIDNGVMIAWQGLLQYNAGEETKIKDSFILPYQRTDDVNVDWIKD